MVQLEDDVYAKLTKDADDNKQIVHLVRIGIGFIIFLILFFTWGVRLIDIDVQKRTYDMEASIAIHQAEINKQVMTIERGDLSLDDYLKWVSIRNDK